MKVSTITAFFKQFKPEPKSCRHVWDMFILMRGGYYDRCKICGETIESNLI